VKYQFNVFALSLALRYYCKIMWNNPTWICSYMEEECNVHSPTSLACQRVNYFSYFLVICNCLVEEETHSYMVNKCNRISKIVAAMKMLIIYTVYLWDYGGRRYSRISFQLVGRTLRNFPMSVVIICWVVSSYSIWNTVYYKHDFVEQKCTLFRAQEYTVHPKFHRSL
jgi:hypothetical protein